MKRKNKNLRKPDKASESKGENVESYLLTWNPGMHNSFDFAKSAKQTAIGKIVKSDWSCGITKNIKRGHRVFLVRLAVEPKGIIGSGLVTKPPYPGEHWDNNQKAKGKEALYIDVKWDSLICAETDQPLLLSKLPGWKPGRHSGWTWTPQNSGRKIPDRFVEKLKKLWAAHIGTSSLGNDFIDDETSAFEGQARLAFVRHRRREQKLRLAKLAQARNQHNGRLFCEVPRCGFDFEAAYGILGKNYAQVHHLKPLADTTKTKLTKLGDLAVVCANCHAIIHRGGECRPLDKLIA